MKARRKKMNINPDKQVLFEYGPLHLNATILWTWVVMAVLTVTSAVITSGLSAGRRGPWENALEAVGVFFSSQVRGIMGIEPSPFVPFLGTLGLFILFSNIMEVVPLFHPPTSSLSTTAALAVCVFFAVPYFGIRKKGLWNHLKTYFLPTPLMLPFHLIAEVSRTISLAVRLFGNIMSEALILAVLLSIVPLFLPLVMQAFGLVIGTVQAYIFFTLAAVYIGSSQAAQHT